jgi:hypothetical protein
MDDLGKGLIVFDDYDTFVKPYDKTVQKLIDDIATMGRHSGTSIFVFEPLPHELYQNSVFYSVKPRTFVLYPAATGNHALTDLLQTYLGFDKEASRRSPTYQVAVRFLYSGGRSLVDWWRNIAARLLHSD